MKICPKCSNDLTLMPAEYDDEPDILECFDCGWYDEVAS